MAKTTLATLLLLMSWAPLVQGQRAKDSLKGLTEVVFSVNSYGSKSQPVLRDVEGDLRMAGIKLVSSDASNKSTAHLNLDLTLACRDRSCGYSVRLQLTQRVRLARKPEVESDAVTWADGYQDAIGEPSLSALNDLYLLDARALIRSFLDDYREANKK